MTGTTYADAPVNASRQHPIDDGERAALLRWALCYWSADALAAHFEWPWTADDVRRYAEDGGYYDCRVPYLRHAVWLGRRARRVSCREGAEQFAEICAKHDVGLVGFHELLEADDEVMRRWVREQPSRRLRAIWRAPRDRFELRAIARRALQPLTLDELRRAILSRSRRVHA